MHFITTICDINPTLRAPTRAVYTLSVATTLSLCSCPTGYAKRTVESVQRAGLTWIMKLNHTRVVQCNQRNGFVIRSVVGL